MVKLLDLGIDFGLLQFSNHLHQIHTHSLLTFFGQGGVQVFFYDKGQSPD